MSRATPMISKLLTVLVMAAAMMGMAFGQRTVRVPIADGFDFPVGKPNADGYYKARGMRLRPPVHFGEDWNGRGGGDTDLGDPIYATANGVVVFAYDVHVGWGNVVIIRHAYRDPSTGQVKYCDSLYGHLLKFTVKVGDQVKRGQQIGQMGSNRGMYPAHLHFEIRHNLSIGMQRESVGRNLENWADPTQFINRYRRLNKEWGKQAVPIGTFQEYRGFKGL
ncbi:murein hydrolase activator EnvC family protein [Haloferula sargassicola]|uniref:M23ase beta-sheet core domain-containing protein n=1 Tax=Haloferula sargassicola TaxID=490096 RepID=A0ABP9UTW1_9BACT